MNAPLFNFYLWISSYSLLMLVIVIEWPLFEIHNHIMLLLIVIAASASLHYVIRWLLAQLRRHHISTVICVLMYLLVVATVSMGRA